jgi:hypothetical protein
MTVSLLLTHFFFLILCRVEMTTFLISQSVKRRGLHWHLESARHCAIFFCRRMKYVRNTCIRRWLAMTRSCSEVHSDVQNMCSPLFYRQLQDRHHQHLDTLPTTHHEKSSVYSTSNHASSSTHGHPHIHTPIVAVYRHVTCCNPFYSSPINSSTII